MADLPMNVETPAVVFFVSAEDLEGDGVSYGGAALSLAVAQDGLSFVHA